MQSFFYLFFVNFILILGITALNPSLNEVYVFSA